MKKPIKPAPKKRPPVTGTLVGVRLQPALLDKLDKWMTDHALLSRPEAVREILRQALKHKK